MKLESLAHLAGISGMISQFMRPEIPDAQRKVFSIIQNEINMIVKLEGDEEQYKLLLKTAASVYSQIAPLVDKATEGKSKDEVLAMLNEWANQSKKGEQ